MSNLEPRFTELLMPALQNRFQLRILDDNKENYSIIQLQTLCVQDNAKDKEISFTLEVDMRGQALVKGLNFIKNIKDCLIAIVSLDGAVGANFCDCI